MNQNPFAIDAGVGSNSFFERGTSVADPVREVELSDVGNTIKEAHSLSKNMEQAKSEGNWIFIDWMADKARAVAGHLYEFMKRAIQLALFKFALEFCAMIIRSLMEALTSGGYGAMDVSTKGVVYHGEGAFSNNRPSGGFSNNPFDSPAFATSRPW